jgi:anti-anti-sigma regulatory factor
MSTAKTQALLAARQAADYVVAVVGRGTMRESPAFRAFAEHCLADEHARLFVDLARCRYLDSTFLGTLVSAHRLGGRRIRVVADQGAQQRLLASTNLHRLLHCGLEAPLIDDACWVSLEHEPSDAASLAKHILQAHRQLAELGGEDASAFARIANRLEDELAAANTAQENS